MATFIAYSITPCCDFLGSQNKVFVPSQDTNNILNNVTNTFLYNGINQVINGIHFIKGYCYTIAVDEFSFDNVSFNFDQFNTTLLNDCDNEECANIGCVKYLIQPCSSGNSFYTYQDLSEYLGKTIRIAGECGEDDYCATVSLCTEETCKDLNVQIISIVDVYDECEDCNLDCYCTTITNNDVIAHTYQYLNCEKELVSVTVPSLQTSDKLCIYRLVGDECLCLEAEANNSSANVYLLPDKINGKHAFFITTDNTAYYIVYNNTLNRWELVNDLSSSIVFAYNLNDCPTGTWTIIAPIYISYTNPNISFTNVLFTRVSSTLYTAVTNGYSWKLEKFQFTPDNCLWKLQFNYLGTWVIVDQFATEYEGCCPNGTYTGLIEYEPLGQFNIINLCQFSTASCGTNCPAYEKLVTDIITKNEECVDNTCPNYCYGLVKCGESEVSIISNSISLYPFYVANKIVKLAGYDGCYSFTVIEDCDCAVSVTVTQSYDSCEDCLPVIAYKFTNCDNSALVQYSSNDYSEYVGKTVELECGGCWIVSQINITPPSTQDPVIQYTFDNCAACKANYYKLTNCTNSEQVIYTDSPLNLAASQISTFKADSINNECSNEFARVTYTYKGITYVKDLSNIGTLFNESIYAYLTSPDDEIFFLRINEDGTEWIIFNTENESETDIVATSPDFINWTGQNNYTNISVSLITLSNPCITVVLDGIEYTLQSTGEDNGKSIYFYVNDVGFDVFEVINLSFNLDTWYLNIGVEGDTQYQLISNINIPISTSWSFVEGTPFNTVSTIACNCKNFIVSIKECPGCFIVETTREPINPTTVTQLEIYSDCEECLPAPVPEPEPESLPKRFIRPGYSVLACDVEKYEKFACKSAEILYKQVLEKRYGITNCCPEGDYDQRWIIKKELADLQGLIDPNYNCTPINTCCNKAPSCNCH